MRYFTAAADAVTYKIGLPLFLSGFVLLSTASHRTLTYVLALFVLPVLWRERRLLQDLDRRLLITLGIFLAYNWTSVFWSQDIGLVDLLGELRPFILISLVGFWVYALFRRIGQVQFERLLAWVFLGYLVLGIGLVLWHFPASGFQTRLTGLGQSFNSILLGATLSIALLAVIGFRDRLRETMPSWLLIAVMIGGAAAILLTMSRGPLLALSAVILMKAFMSRERLPIVVALLLLIFVPAFLYFRFGGADQEISLSSLALLDPVRLLIWRDVLELAPSRLVFGYGLSTELAFATQVDGRGFTGTHNIYLGTIFHLGLVGLVLLGAMYAHVAKLAWRLPHGPMRRFIFGLLLFAGLQGLFEFDLVYMNVHTEWLVFWLPVMLTLAIATRGQTHHLDGGVSSNTDQASAA